MTRPAAPITLHRFALSGHSHRAELMLSLLGLPHTLVEVDLLRGQQQSADFRALNLFAQVPVIQDGDFVLADSNAILVYLAQRYDTDHHWLPRDPQQQAEVQRWLGVAAGPLHRGPAVARWRTLMKQDGIDEPRAIARQLFERIEQHLQLRDWLVGDRASIADVALYSYTRHAPEGAVPLTPYPRLSAWLARIEAMPGFVPMQASALPAATPGAV